MPRSGLAGTTPPLPDVGPASQPIVWLLMGGRAGDNNQLLALATKLGFPFEAKRLTYNWRRRVPRRRPGLLTLTKDARAGIAPPWPDLVLCVGYASVPVARLIREQSRGRTKLVHVGNPRENLDDFDLQITTPQYPRAAPNLLELPFPIGNPARNSKPTEEELRWLRDFPHPRRLVAVGGPARHWELDERALLDAVRELSRKEPRGSLIVATSSRTRERTKRALREVLGGPHRAIVESFPSFGTLLSECQEIHVTADSVSMLSEAILSGRPVGKIPIRRSLVGRFSEWLWERPLGRSTTPDLRSFWRFLHHRRLIGTTAHPVATEVGDTIQRAADAVRALLGPRERSSSVKGGSSSVRVWALLGDKAGDNDQVVALAEALGLPFEIKKLEYNGLARFGPGVVGRSLISLTKASQKEVLGEPPPDLTISVGHRSVPTVRVLRHRSKGRTRSIHLGFPRVSPGEFDLVVTTPQYPVPDHPNVLRVPFAITSQAKAVESRNDDQLAWMPSPRRLLVVGGPTEFWRIDEDALRNSLVGMIDEAHRNGGSILATTSPRTPPSVRTQIGEALSGTDVPFILAGPGQEPDYASLLGEADSITVTADSVAMVSDAIWTGKPIKLVPIANNLSGRVTVRANDLLRPGRRLYPRDLRFFWRSLAGMGIGVKRGVPKVSPAIWRKTIVERARAVLDRG